MSPFFTLLMVCPRLDELHNECVDAPGAKKIAPVVFAVADIKHRTLHIPDKGSTTEDSLFSLLN